MAGLNCRVTVALLGVLLLGAARLSRGGGECGAAGARGAEGALGAEGLHRPPRWGGDGAGGAHGRLGLPGSPAPGSAASGVVAVPSWIPRDLAQGSDRGKWRCPGAGSTAVVGATSRAPADKKERRCARKPGPGNLAEVARRALGGSTWIIDGAGLGVRRELPSLAHPLPQRLGQRNGARKRWFGATTSHLFTHLFPCPSGPFSLSRSSGTLILK